MICGKERKHKKQLVLRKKYYVMKQIKEHFVITIAVLIVAAAVFFFLVPSHYSVSSISGLAIILSNYIPLPVSAITMILNVLLLVVGFITCGNEFGIKTVYTSILLPLFIGMFELLLPNYTCLKCQKCKDMRFINKDDVHYYIYLKDVTCPKCGSELKAGTGKRGLYIRCQNGDFTNIKDYLVHKENGQI